MKFLLRLFFKWKTLFKFHGYFGDYPSFDEAKKASGGYHQENIIQKVRMASLAVKDGKALFERDGLAFNSEFSWPASSYFESLANENNGNLNVLDFGGALGSYYFPLVKNYPNIHFQWTIVEQAEFVKIGKDEFATTHLHFSDSLSDSLRQQKYDIVLLGCVLPYLPNPYAVLGDIIQANPKAILIDKHPVIKGTKDRITVQHIPPSIYQASYPAWFFSESKFLKFMTSYHLEDSYLCPDICNVNADFKTYFYRRLDVYGNSSSKDN